MPLAFSTTARRLSAASLLLTAAFAPEMAFADTLCTPANTITTLPKVITAPGQYCVNSALAHSGNTGAIVVSTNNVVIDCNDNEITYTGVAAGSSGIKAIGRSDVEVRHCRLLNFANGIEFLSNSRRIWIHDNAVSGSSFVGVSLDGRESEIARNTVVDTTGARAIRTITPAGGSNYVHDNVVRRSNGADAQLVGFTSLGGGRTTVANNVGREIGVPTTSVAVGVRIATDAALAVAPVVVKGGAMFRGDGIKSLAVQALPGSGKAVCEDVGAYGYTLPPTPGCL